LIPTLPDFPDPFAVEWGHDEYGTFQSFAVENIVQRMRWIPPGTFIMGSPVDEAGRYHDEVQHRVEITRGFWLGDTPVTQGLWEAVMGTYRSRFKEPTRPVEPVSRHDCLMFLERLNDHVEGLDVRLPTEAEWEYSCRAGTTTAMWIGNLQGREEQWAPQLDSIAWYAGNAGLTTHPVAQKAANPWGLYDMLGNVWEWCEDWFAPYDVTTIRDPMGPAKGGKRVIRGGSWHSEAKRLRAANRDANYPELQSDRVGLRLAQSPARIGTRSQ